MTKDRNGMTKQQGIEGAREVGYLDAQWSAAWSLSVIGADGRIAAQDRYDSLYRACERLVVDVVDDMRAHSMDGIDAADGPAWVREALMRYDAEDQVAHVLSADALTEEHVWEMTDAAARLAASQRRLIYRSEFVTIQLKEA